MQSLIDFNYAAALNQKGISVKAHIKIDTGMHRLGISADECEKAGKIFAMKNIEVCGIFTHLCCADHLTPDDVAFTKRQIDSFYDLLADLQAARFIIAFFLDHEMNLLALSISAFAFFARLSKKISIQLYVSFMDSR